MPEPVHPDRVFPLLTRAHPLSATLRSTRFVRFLLDRSAFGAPALSLISASAAWARLLALTGERHEAVLGQEGLEFLRLWQAFDASANVRSRTKVSHETRATKGWGEPHRAVSAPASALKEPLPLPGEEKRSSRLHRLAALVATEPDDSLWIAQQALPMVTRVAGQQTRVHDRTPAGSARTSTGFTEPSMVEAQSSRDTWHDRSLAGSGTDLRKTDIAHGETRYGSPFFPALSSAEFLAGRMVNHKARIANRNLPGQMPVAGAHASGTLSLHHAASFLRIAQAEARPGQSSVRESIRSRPIPAWSAYAALSQGRPLGVMTRVILERSFPTLKLSQVRVHTDAAADEATRDLGADAFVLGPDLFFRTGAFNPLTDRGLALLTHELVHVQQGEEAAAPGRRDLLEREALAIEHALLRPYAHQRAVRQGPARSPARVTAEAFSPPALEFSRSVPPARGSTVPAARTAAMPPARTVSRPLTAEANRTLTPERDSSSELGSGNADALDQEGFSRRFFRMLERSVRTEQERRGIDRWVP